MDGQGLHRTVRRIGTNFDDLNKLSVLKKAQLLFKAWNLVKIVYNNIMKDC